MLVESVVRLHNEGPIEKWTGSQSNFTDEFQAKTIPSEVTVLNKPKVVALCSLSIIR